MQYFVQEHEIYSRSPYGALMYARIFNSQVKPEDVLDGFDVDLNFEDRPMTKVKEDYKTHSAPRYWDYEQRKLVDNIKDIKARWYYVPMGCC
jgi:hypothetical protein